MSHGTYHCTICDAAYQRCKCSQSHRKIVQGLCPTHKRMARYGNMLEKIGSLPPETDPSASPPPERTKGT